MTAIARSNPLFAEADEEDIAFLGNGLYLYPADYMIDVMLREEDGYKKFDMDFKAAPYWVTDDDEAFFYPVHNDADLADILAQAGAL